MSIANVALMVWFAVTFVNVWLVTAPTEAPSTSTFATWNPAIAPIVKLWFAPEFTTTAPLGEMLPFAPADAVMV